MLTHSLFSQACFGSNRKVRILVPERLRPYLEGLCSEFEDLELVYAESEAAMPRMVPGCHAVAGYVGNEVVRNGRDLRWVQALSAGVEGLVYGDGLSGRDIQLTNVGAMLAPQLAEHSFALLLALTRNLRHDVEAMGRATWESGQGLPLAELYGRTMLILGLGSIGIAVAERAAAFGMRVIATKGSDFYMVGAVDYVGRPDELDELLPEADVIVVCVPNTPDNRMLLGPAQFASMREGVYIVNVARGVIIDTDALMAALGSGKVAGAGLDVTDPEPLPDGHPLWSHPRVVIAPHTGGLSDRMLERQAALVRDNIGRFLRGLPLKNPVNREKGY